MEEEGEGEGEGEPLPVPRLPSPQLPPAARPSTPVLPDESPVLPDERREPQTTTASPSTKGQATTATNIPGTARGIQRVKDVESAAIWGKALEVFLAERTRETQWKEGSQGSEKASIYTPRLCNRHVWVFGQNGEDYDAIRETAMGMSERNMWLEERNCWLTVYREEYFGFNGEDRQG